MSATGEAIMRTMILALVLWLSSHLAVAVEPANLVVWGNGQLSCGAYIEARNAPKHAVGSYDDTFTQWFLGFVTAYNWENVGNPDWLQDTDVDGAILWLENYCKQHPLESFFYAIAALEQELTKE